MSNATNEKEFLIQQIRTQYTAKQHTEVDQLKELDNKVKRPAVVFAYVYGSISALVMGSGMSLVMTEIGAMLGLTDTMVPGIVIGIVGMVMALTTYPLYNKVLSARRKKFAPQILELSEKILNG